MIWTTTPWTLPANLAVAVQPRADYSLYRIESSNGPKLVVLADELASKVAALSGNGDVTRIDGWTGRDLEGVRYNHPFTEDERERRVVLADYVTLEDGTGLVHTAPGHGTEDYQTGLAEEFDVYCPVRADGTYDDTVPDWLRGKSIWIANAEVVDHLEGTGHLYHQEQFTHSYPHDWRGKSPVIFRATEQWFVAVDEPYGEGEKTMRERAMEATQRVEFFPAWGRNRMRGMLESRPDWCISRQRAWGLPIPAFLGPEPGQVLLTPASVRAVAKLIAEKGSDAWFVAPPRGSASTLRRGERSRLPRVVPPSHQSQLTTHQIHRYLRRLVRVGLLMERGAPAAHRQPGRARQPVPRRLRPASRLVPTLASMRPGFYRAISV